MVFRSAKERLIQSVAFETIGLVVVAPVYALIFDKSGYDALGLFLILTLSVTLWAPIHNSVFDRIEYKLAKRTACKRPGALRACHALSIELTSIAITLPLIFILGDHSISEVLAINIGLTAFYTVYAFVFYLAYDALWPLSEGFRKH